MEIDIELYRRQVLVSTSPRTQLSAIDIAPEHAQGTCLFLHGFGGQARQWIYQLQHFALQYRVIALDMYGHGRADDPPGEFSMERLVESVHTALENLGVTGKVVLMGHSFGGAVAAEFAARHPDSVERLVLIATVAEFKLNPLYRFALHLPLPLLRLVEPFIRKQVPAGPPALKLWYHRILVPWNGWSIFRSLDLPTLVIRGHRDFLFDKPLFQEVTRAIPGAEEEDVGASGHMVMLERRQAVNRAIERFLGSRQRSWRDEDIDTESVARTDLVRQRRWLVHYDDGVSHTIATPQVPLHQLLRSAERRFARRNAIHFEGYRLTYRQLGRRANRFANALLALDLAKGDRLLLLLPNLPQLVIAYLGTLIAGGVAVFTLPVAEPKELVRQARDSGAKIAVSMPNFPHLESLLQERTDLRHIILTDISECLPLGKRLAWRLSHREKGPRLASASSGEKRTHAFADLIRSHDDAPPQLEVSPLDPAVIQYTGGTTAEAKGVLLSHRNLLANTIQTRHWMPQAREGAERFLCVLPYSHSYGLTTGLNVPIALGATLIIKSRFEVEETLKSVKRLRPTIFPGVPQMYLAISHHPGVRKYGIDSIEACISGSAPLPVEVQEEFEKLTRGRLVEGYGLTEASPVTHANPLYGRRKIGSIGIPLPSTEAKIIDLADSEKIVPPGQIGELMVRGPQVMVGYWQDPEASAEALTDDGWLHTGDVAQMDADGYFRIIARKADMWYSGMPGKLAFPRDVEEVLYEVPQVKEVAVVAIAGRPIAFVIAKKERPSTDSLIAYCRRRLPPGLAPRLIIFLDDFPRTFIGKVLRRELAKRYEHHSS